MIPITVLFYISIVLLIFAIVGTVADIIDYDTIKNKKLICSLWIMVICFQIPQLYYHHNKTEFEYAEYAIHLTPKHVPYIWKDDKPLVMSLYFGRNLYPYDTIIDVHYSDVGFIKGGHTKYQLVIKDRPDLRQLSEPVYLANR